MAVTRIQFLLLAGVMFAARAMAQQEVSFDAARVDAASGDHRAALQKIAKLLSSYKAPPPAERYEILMLKAECQLQLKDRMGSVTTFKSAAKSAGDLNQLAAARANAVIVERSSNGAYKSAFGSADPPIDILSPDSRKKAMAKLLQELWSKHKRDFDAAMRADTLPPSKKSSSPSQTHTHWNWPPPERPRKPVPS